MNIVIPIKIITPKIPGKQDSVFYTGKNIASVRISNREYILTTEGSYTFAYYDQSGRYRDGNERSGILKRWNDRNIQTLSKEGLITEWGWFEINVWDHTSEKPVCLLDPVEEYSCYDEALKAFKKFVEADLTSI